MGCPPVQLHPAVSVSEPSKRSLVSFHAFAQTVVEAFTYSVHRRATKTCLVQCELLQPIRGDFTGIAYGVTR